MTEHEHEAPIYSVCACFLLPGDTTPCPCCPPAKIVRYVPPCCVRAARREALELAAADVAKRMQCPFHARGLYDTCMGCATALEAREIEGMIRALLDEEPRNG